MRKSMQQRIEEANSLLEQYVAANMAIGRSYRFLIDMRARMERGKYMTAGQRKYFDNLVSQGVPTVKNEERVATILAAAEVDGIGPSAGILKDFAYKIGRGWNLSEKQEKYLSSLLTKANDLKVNGRYNPTTDMIEKLKAARELLRGKGNYYWMHRPGTARAVDKATTWLDWHSQRELIEEVNAFDVDSTHTACEEPIIDEWTCNKMLSAVKKQLTELENPKHSPGDMRWINGRLGLITAAPIVVDKSLRYECLIEGMTHIVPTSDIRKRRN